LNSIEGDNDGEDPQKASLCRLPPLVFAPDEGKAAGKNLRQPAMSKFIVCFSVATNENRGFGEERLFSPGAT